MDAEPRCQVGVATIIPFRHHILVGERKGSHCAGYLSCPGGHIQLHETPLQCGERECFEEVLDYRTDKGLRILVEPIGPGRPQLFLRHDFMEGGRLAYVTLFLRGRLLDPTGIDIDRPFEGAEPGKCELWRWKTFP